jgi:hypothetical protein
MMRSFVHGGAVMNYKNILNSGCLAAIIVWSVNLHAASYVEKEGRYEINWSTGKVRFYGVAKLGAEDANFRTAEQQAWANGLKLAEKNVPALLGSRLGKVSQTNPEKLSKLATATVSVGTTYFGDQRVKVVLEAPVTKITPQLVQQKAGHVALPANDSFVMIRLPKQAAPVAFVQIVDDAGREMLAASDVASAVEQGAGLSRWFKKEATFEGTEKPSQVTEIKGEIKSPGVIKIAAASWRPEYAGAIASGRGLFVVE